MRDGSAWTHLRKLLDTAQDTALVSFAFDAHAATTGQLRELAARGSEALRSFVASDVRRKGDTFVDANDIAWYATRDEHLARLFSALGLDARLRRHSRQLSLHAKADIVRVIAGEVERAEGLKHVQSEEGFWRERLLMGLAGAALQIYTESLIVPRRSRSASACNFRRPDAKLASLLHSGSARSIISRLQAMLKGPHSAFGIRASLATFLPKLIQERNLMRLSVFVQVLQCLCRPSATPISSVAAAEHSALVADVAEGILAAGLPFLPYESSDQVAAVRQSLYLSQAQSHGLAELMRPLSSCMVVPESQSRSWDDFGMDTFGVYPLQPATLRLDPNMGFLSATTDDLPSTAMPQLHDSQQLIDPQTADFPMRPSSQGSRSASPSHRSLSPRFSRQTTPAVRPLTEANVLNAAVEGPGSIDERLWKPYDEYERLRPWVPVDSLARFNGLAPDQSQRFLGDVHYMPRSMQMQHDDRAVLAAMVQNPGSWPVGHLTERTSWKQPLSPRTRYPLSPRTRYPLSPRAGSVREVMQESADDLNLRRLLTENQPAFYSHNGANSYQFAKAATQFRRLAAAFDHRAVDADLDFRTAALLNSSPVW
jgi:hypothetical protein